MLWGIERYKPGFLSFKIALFVICCGSVQETVYSHATEQSFTLWLHMRRLLSFILFTFRSSDWISNKRIVLCPKLSLSARPLKVFWAICRRQRALTLLRQRKSVFLRERSMSSGFWQGKITLAVFSICWPELSIGALSTKNKDPNGIYDYFLFSEYVYAYGL